MAEAPDGRRRRPAVSCYLCRKRKIRCNRERPCSNCIRARSSTCVYENPQRSSTSPRFPLKAAQASPSTLESPAQPSTTADDASNGTRSALPSQPASSLATSSSTASTPASQSTASDVESMMLKLRIRQLEEQLSGSHQKPSRLEVAPPQSAIETMSWQLGGSFHVYTETGAVEKSAPIARSIIHKTRFFGQSHWGTSGVFLIRDIFELMDTRMREVVSMALPAVERCKALGRIIKSRRAPAWPTLLTADLPDKEVCDALIDCYIKSTESIYRILHIPAFRRDYNDFWVSSDEKPAFLVQLKLVLAIGAVTYDEAFSLHTSAVRWVYEATTWLAEPKFKSRLNLPHLQTNILLLIAAETVAVGADSTWVSAGALLRRAMAMGLHRDPTHLPPRIGLTAEIRRRLWSTILELCLQSASLFGGPPLISLDMFDTAPPGNFNDDQLSQDGAKASPAEVFTQTSISIALRESFPRRLAVIEYLNHISSRNSYEETLKLDRELRAAYKTMTHTLQTYRGPDPQSSPSDYELGMVDLIMLRYLTSLHAPYFGPALQETAYAYSRKVVVEASVKVWRAINPPGSAVATWPNDDAAPSDHGGIPRLLTCAAGFYQAMTIHAALLIAMELRAQLREDDSLGPVFLRPDLLKVLEDSKAWGLRVVKAGGTNTKGLALMSVVAAQINGMQQGLDKAGTAGLMVKALEHVMETCLPILQQMAAGLGYVEETQDGLLQGPLPVSDSIEDWGFMMSDVLFTADNAEPVSWMFGNDNHPAMAPAW